MVDSNFHDETIEPQPERRRRPDAEAGRPPEHVGRYRVEKALGQGGFGVVYLARDEQLDRLVAIKVPHVRLISKLEDTQAYLSEARTVAHLDHPHIVPVYDVGSTESCLCYVVSKYIEGTDLATRRKTQPLSYTEAAALVATVAEALHYAHKQGLVHRDVKPGNILLDKHGQPFVVDFGLALREDNLGQGPRYAGTPAYMSPEQARGEGHRVDGRSDVFSLGVVFYELLVSKPPFRGDTQAELLEQIASYEPRPLVQYDEKIPKELQRICFRALAKRASERYSSAHEMADDLRHFLAGQACTPAVATPAGAATPSDETATATPVDTPVGSAAASSTRTGSSSGSQRLKIVPKGLRSFDKEDKDFFLELLPGPRDREGLPDTIRFWKTRIEEMDADTTFAVSVMYGPSGCGKSSLVKAGLLPQLAPHILPIFVEATPNDTELRMLKTLRKHVPRLAAEASLAEAVAQLREGRATDGRKILLVLDQFEQWLHATAEMDSSQLVRALRQCNGGNVQCLIMVRDDFWMSTTRFMQALEIPQVENQNSAAVDLFDPSHARKVLQAFGLAYGRLPEHDLSADEQRFLDRAVQDLTHDGKVICVQLSLLGDMMKGRPWTPTSLHEVGGTSGVGVAFLDETFTAKTAPPTHRLHAKAAQAVLMALLPDAGTDIKGQMQPAERLLECSGYTERPGDFRDLLQILNRELRLITPTEPEEAEAGTTEPTPAAADRRFYQLTHDYLVPSLRTWLTRKQKETRRGRAELKLVERAALWSTKPENRYLPSLFEYANIRALTQRKNWTEAQQKFMRRASRVHVMRTGLAVALVAAAGIAALKIHQGVDEQQKRTQAEGLVNTLVNADTPQVPEIVKQLREYAQWADPQLTKKVAEADDGSADKLHLSLALVDQDDQQVDYLYDELLHANAARFPVIRDALVNYQSRLLDRLWSVVTGAEEDTEQQRLRAAGALAAYDPRNAKWNDVAADTAGQLVAVNPVFIGQWQEALRPVAHRLVPPLAKIFADPQQSELPRSLATLLLTEYAKDDVEALTNLLVDADAKSFTELFPALERHGQAAVAQLQAVLARKVEPTWSDSPSDPTWKVVTPEMRFAIEAAHGMLAERFAFCQAMPWDTFSGVREALEASGYWPTRVRPWLSGDQGLVAAVWTRDGQRRELQTDLTKEQLPAPDVPAEKDGQLPADIAVVPSTDPSSEPQFVVLWGPPIAAGEQRRIIVDVSEKELTDAQYSLAKQGFAAQCAISVWTDVAGERHYVGIWSNQGSPSELRADYGGFELVHEPQWDVAVAPATKPDDPLDACRKQLAQIATLRAPRVDEPQQRLARARAQYYLGQLVPALADLDFLVEKQAISVSALQYRTWTLARLGKVDEARTELSKYLEQEKDPSVQAFVQIVLAAWLGNMDEAVPQLDAMVTASEQNADAFYSAACAAALASQACAESDAERSQQFADRAIDLLGIAVTRGYNDAQHLRTDVDLAPLHGDPRFLTLLEKLEPPRRFAGVWQADVESESRLIAPQSPESLLKQAREFAAQGFRPVAIALSEPQGGATSAPSLPASRLPPEACMAWHRPLIPDDRNEQLAERQANAAVALLRLREADQVWPLLRHQSDSRLRSYLLDRLASYRADPVSLWQRLLVEKDDSTRRALILGLGDLSDAELLSTPQQATISAELVHLYQDDADPGIHGAAEWTLKKLGKQAELTRVRSALATGEPAGQRRWYVTKQGQHTMVILKPQEPFLMGSPVSEAERAEGPTGQYEIRHRRRINRAFAISAHEVTVEQFRTFEEDHGHKQWSRQADAPMGNLTWYQTAQYCNWLSQQEGLPEDQWCYDPSQPFADGMRPYDDYLLRIGYRLPTEAEWEYGCRALATTARPYGETKALLSEYAWCIEDSRQRWMLPVGSLKPNDFGLFDMLGNVLEWCQNDWRYYPNDCPLLEDTEQVESRVVRDAVGRVFRGGSFLDNAHFARSASRSFDQPNDRSGSYGFRLARTYP